MNNEQLKKKSKQGAIISFSGFLIIILVFVFAAFQLNDLNETIKLKTEKLTDLDSTIFKQSIVIEANQLLVNDLVDEINKLRDTIIQPKARAVEIPGIFDSQKRQIYDFTAWITTSQHTLNNIIRVTYKFGHDTFIIIDRVSNDSSNGFLVSYRGWGCLSVVKVTVEYEDAENEVLYFNMCDAIGW